MTLDVNVHHPLGRITLEIALSSDARLLVLLGASGSGKTSLLHVIAGLIRPSRGIVKIDDEVLTDTRENVFVPPYRRRIGYVFQDPRLFPHLNVRHNLTYGAGRQSAGVDLDQVVRLLDLGEFLTRRTSHLSGGERQRVAIGRALLSQPRLLLLDEPLSSVDVARRAEVLPYLDRLRAELNLPTIYVTHTWSEVEHRADAVVTLDAGRVVSHTMPGRPAATPHD